MDPDNESGYTTKGWTGPDIRLVPGLALTVGDYEGCPHFCYTLHPYICRIDVQTNTLKITYPKKTAYFLP